MGIRIFAENSDYEFNIMYGSFKRMRQEIAYILDPNYGELYQTLGDKIWYSHDAMEDIVRKLDLIESSKHLDSDIVSFLWIPDTDGSYDSKGCGKLYDLIKDVPLEDNYGWPIEWVKFKMFLKECYNTGNEMRWH